MWVAYLSCVTNAWLMADLGKGFNLRDVCVRPSKHKQNRFS
jgi:hypothetical protein